MPTKKRKKSVLNAIDRYLLQKKYSLEKEDSKTEKAIQVVLNVPKNLVPIVKRKEAKLRSSVTSAPNRKSETKILSSKVRLRKTAKKDTKTSPIHEKKSSKVELPNSRKSIRSKIPETSSKTPKIKLLSPRVLARSKKGPVNQNKSYKRANNKIELATVERSHEGRIRKNAKDPSKTAQVTKVSSSSKDESSGGNEIVVEKPGKLSRTTKRTSDSQASNKKLEINSSGKNRIMMKKPEKVSRTVDRVSRKKSISKNVKNTFTGLNKITSKRLGRRTITTPVVPANLSSAENLENTLTGENQITTQEAKRPSRNLKRVPSRQSSGGDDVTGKKSEKLSRTTERFSKRKSNTENIENNSTGKNQITKKQPRKFSKTTKGVSEKQSSTESIKNETGNRITRKQREKLSETTKDISEEQSGSECIENNSENQITKKRIGKLSKTSEGVSEKQSNTESIKNKTGNRITRKRREKLSETTKDVSEEQSGSECIENNLENQITKKRVGKLSKTSEGVSEKQLSTESIKNDSAGSRKITSERSSSPIPKKKQKVVKGKTDIAETCSPIVESEPSSTHDEVVPSSHDSKADTEMNEEMTKIVKKYQPYMEQLKSLSSDDIKKYIQDHQQYYIDYKEKMETKTEIAITPGKKPRKNDEMKESFKCNPFNSQQQLAMYYTFRELFHVPKTHFLECRNFFTALLPEVACQLFAETFHVKVTIAPRLIKKLYPNPVSPV